MLGSQDAVEASDNKLITKTMWQRVKRYSALVLGFSMLLFLIFCAITESSSMQTIVVFCNPGNDLYQVLRAQGHTCHRYDDIDSAIAQTDTNGILLILAKNYPQQKTIIPPGFYEEVSAKRLKVYVEYPDRLTSEFTGDIRSTMKERLVVTSDFFGEELPSLSILDAGLYSYVHVRDRSSHLRGGTIAGFKQAIYGMDQTPSAPILFDDKGILVSTSKLSDFRRSRYAPHRAWQVLLGRILSDRSIESNARGDWLPLVVPTYDSTHVVQRDMYREAIRRGTQWYIGGRFLIHASWRDQWRGIDTLPLPVGPPIDSSYPSGDGTYGVMEGHYSYIHPDGSQPYRYWLRADCVAETAMTFAMSSDVLKGENSRQISDNLMDFLYFSTAFRSPQSLDPGRSSYGLIGWADTHPSRYYGDDNARVILGSILASTVLGERKWDDPIVAAILGNFRTAGYKGFRGGSLNGSDIDQITWPSLMARDLEHIAPHYESWLWATYLWLYDKTGYQQLLTKAKRAVEITMSNYPDQWRWTNGIQQERARMILPLSWLVRVDDTERHRKWLRNICDDLLDHQVACGGLQEELGVGSQGRYNAPQTNEDYGTSEAPLIQVNGDPVVDMLYTTNFAFFALNEAAHATGDPDYLEAVEKLADFLVRIQSSCATRGDLDGCWFRAFDYDQWEYYGSNADHGWGAWGTLTGWTQSFITTTLALTIQETSYWDFTHDSKIGEQIHRLWNQMLPGVDPD